MSLMLNTMQNMKKDFDEQLSCFKQRIEELETENKEMRTDLSTTKKKLSKAEGNLGKMSLKNELFGKDPLFEFHFVKLLN